MKRPKVRHRKRTKPDPPPSRPISQPEETRLTDSASSNLSIPDSRILYQSSRAVIQDAEEERGQRLAASTLPVLLAALRAINEAGGPSFRSGENAPRSHAGSESDAVGSGDPNPSVASSAEDTGKGRDIGEDPPECVEEPPVEKGE